MDTDHMDHMDHMSADDANSADGEGVWAPDIEQCFHEALALIPPCGRRKHILQEEGGGKMYGRNELIARHIFQKTGKIRTRKQVSSHIQVLARRKAKVDVSTSNGSTPSPSSTASLRLGPTCGGGSLNSSSQSSLASSAPPSNNCHHNNNHNTVNHSNGNGLSGNGISTTSLHQNHQNRHHHHLLHNHFHDSLSGHFAASTNNTANLVGTVSPVGSVPIGTNYMGASNGNSNGLARIVNATTPITTPTTPSAARLFNGNGSNGQSVGLVGSTKGGHHYHGEAGEISDMLAVGGAVGNLGQHAAGGYYDVWADRPVVTQKIRLVEFSAFFEHHRNSTNATAAANSSPAAAAAPPTTTTAVSTTSTSPEGSTVHHHHHQSNNQDHLLSSAARWPSVARSAFVSIDYTQPISRHLANRLEEIDVSQIQDKFPGIGGPDGLFQSGPSDAFYLVKFWTDLSNHFDYNLADQNSYFGFSNHFETVDPYRTITSSLKACSYGEQVIEKVDKIYGAFNSSNGRYSYEINRSPMCEFLVQFIKKLRQMPRISHMNIVLENFTVLHVITSDSTNEILLCLAYVFEVVPPEQNNGPQHHVYRLTKCS